MAMSGAREERLARRAHRPNGRVDWLSVVPLQEWLLARRAKAGDPEAFREYVRRNREEAFRLLFDHQGSIWRLATRYFKDPHNIEEMVDESFVRADRGLESYRGDASPKTWLLTICENVCIDEFRKRGRRPPTEPLDVELPAPGPWGGGYGLDLKRALESLSPAEKEAWYRVDVLGFTCQEAGALLGRSRRRMQYLVECARKKLRKFLDDDGPPPGDGS